MSLQILLVMTVTLTSSDCRSVSILHAVWCPRCLDDRSKCIGTCGTSHMSTSQYTHVVFCCCGCVKVHGKRNIQPPPARVHLCGGSLSSHCLKGHQGNENCFLQCTNHCILITTPSLFVWFLKPNKWAGGFFLVFASVLYCPSAVK